ncbi:hypothetical protein MRB53_025410 [Persea americana]|uniref:Uncharacterized protein n=1 Tax=Persea americana TaxID=3435 RepID=A0ACC2LF62_PERAE|nr:hypothetical protein MRB53_025410 [Persea americana]
MDTIIRCFSKRTVEEILSALGTGDWTTTTIQLLEKASPISLKISIRLIREGRYQSIDQCLRREYRMLCHVLQEKSVMIFMRVPELYSWSRTKVPSGSLVSWSK